MSQSPGKAASWPGFTPWVEEGNKQTETEFTLLVSTVCVCVLESFSLGESTINGITKSLIRLSVSVSILCH